MPSDQALRGKGRQNAAKDRQTPEASGLSVKAENEENDNQVHAKGAARIGQG
ncbi:MAG: hypothetical protein GX849_01955 [Clostridiaceae bacterium]|jgi:hypothetical protein|nr:hypothetical protein [Clostridiaceae bacterium]